MASTPRKKSHITATMLSIVAVICDFIFEFPVIFCSIENGATGKIPGQKVSELDPVSASPCMPNCPLPSAHPGRTGMELVCDACEVTRSFAAFYQKPSPPPLLFGREAEYQIIALLQCSIANSRLAFAHNSTQRLVRGSTRSVSQLSPLPIDPIFPHAPAL